MSSLSTKRDTDLPGGKADEESRPHQSIEDYIDERFAGAPQINEGCSAAATSVQRNDGDSRFTLPPGTKTITGRIY
jgi:hypothetical protein